ncbi:MAG: STAS domain-containing protein [Vicinamibacterales bacterium]
MTPSGSRSSTPFTTDCVRNANEVLLRVSGRLVDPRPTRPEWHDCLQRLAAADVRVDLGAVTEIDARGLGMLAELTRQTRAGGGRLSVVSASPRVRRLLRLTHLDGLLTNDSTGPDAEKGSPDVRAA